MSYGGNVGYAPTLPQALAQVVPGGWPRARPAAPGPAPGRAAVRLRVGLGEHGGAGYLQQAETYYSQAQAALKSGDLASYGRYIAKVKKALDKAQQAAQARSPAAAPRRRAGVGVTVRVARR